jgi:substrate import-associated zinc metallohydrolase lipoprotein
MKKIIICIVTCALAVAGGFWSCVEEGPRPESIFEDPVESLTAFDKWLLENYTYPYNIQFKYKMEDIESDRDYELVPAQEEKAFALAKIFKFLFLEVYDEVAGVDFMRTYSFRVIHLIGSPAYTGSAVKKGSAESGMKITLYQINNRFTPDNITQDLLSEYFLKTMYHEFSHILHQQKAFPVEFQHITGTEYISGEWDEYTNEEALVKGFISAYARQDAYEDFVETIAFFVVKPDGWWEEQMAIAGEAGAASIAAKFEIIENYLKETWKIDIHALRASIQRRFGELNNLNLTDLLE